ETDQAKIAFGKVSRESHRYDEAKLLLADLYLRENSVKPAKEAVQAVLTRSGSHYNALEMMGEIHMRENALQEAKACYKAMIRIAPDRPEGFYRLGRIERKQKNYEQAIALFETALAKKPDSIDAFIHLVTSLAQNNEIDKAIERCNQRLQNQAEKAKQKAILLNLKGKLLLRSERQEEAEQVLKAALMEFPDYLPAYYTLARLYLSNNRAAEAIRQYRQAVDSGVREDIAHMMLGIIYYAQKKPEQAQQQYRRAIENNPEFVPAVNNLAYLLAEEDKNLHEALRLAEKAKNLLPGNPLVQDTLGWVYVKLGLYDNAIREFMQSKQKMPDHPTIHYHLGVAYHKKGEVDKARKALSKALALDTDFDEAKQARRILSKL
ncbi:MAG TPA: tetratricopeptide repeat protein, partial [Desulfosalsimonadaceae bacterium]|nr:tetratricopeptide repeat protein [Desulfosalsimonadaceae bacterium]